MQVLHHLNKFDDPNILIGFNSIDDAGVYKLTDDLALVQTVDFFPPIVDDPYDFGAVACANSLSDVYAMGGKPISALNLVGFPSNKLPLKVLEEILKGGADKAKEAGVSIIGGHTIKTKEPLYGLSVTGVVHPQKIIKNSGAEKGDLLILTKPLGSGIITTALKQGKTNEELEDKVTGIMAALNKSACEAMVEVGIKAATDITGFGLLGHLWEVCSSSGVGAEIYLSRIPTIKEVWDLAAQKFVPGGTLANLKFSEDKVVWEERIDQVAKFVLADAQTSGGLLIFCPQEKKDKLLELLKNKKVLASNVIGETVEDKRCKIKVRM